MKVTDSTRSSRRLICGTSLVMGYLTAAAPVWAQSAAVAQVETEISVESEGGALAAESETQSEVVQVEVPTAGGDYPYAGPRADEHRFDVRARFRQLPYMKRYVPQKNLWELGLFTGVLFPSPDHNLQVPQLTHEEYSKVAAQLGGRIAYFPLAFLGGELEAYGAGGSVRGSGYSSMLYAMRAHAILQLPFWSVTPFALVGGGTMGAISEQMGHDRDPAFHFGAGVKVPVQRHVTLRLDVLDTLTQKFEAKNGRQTHHPEINMGVSFVVGRTAPPLPADTDYDGLFDAEDQCPLVGALTIDGCPGDTDGDGLTDDVDACPAVAAATADGCPNLDEDGDGVPVPADQCPDEQGPAPSGCPDKDPDGDGIIGADDNCPKEPENRNGFQDDDGCPDEMPEAVRQFTGVIPGINFKQGTAEVEASSSKTLDAVVAILKDHPSIRLEVSGHTSSEGSEERNQELSAERANAVRDYLVAKGIEGDRIVARGVGASEPVADNANKAGREKNRRIEFRILAQP